MNMQATTRDGITVHVDDEAVTVTAPDGKSLVTGDAPNASRFSFALKLADAPVAPAADAAPTVPELPAPADAPPAADAPAPAQTDAPADASAAATPSETPANG